MDEIIIVSHKLPDKIKGLVTPNADGTYTIFVNRNLTDEQQKATVQHELKHIRHGHFCSDTRSVDQIESECHDSSELIVSDQVFHYISF